jgi:hypothetical protein
MPPKNAQTLTGTADAAKAGAPTPLSTAVPRIAWAPVLTVVFLVGAVMVVTSANYARGFDELYFLVAGRDHPALGYFDQPPLVPLLAGLLDRWFPGSLVALRLPVSLAAAAGAGITALIAREFGGGRGAQAMAAGAYGCSGIITVSHWLATYTLDPFFWTLLTWLVVRWVRLHQAGVRDDRPLLWAGVVTAVSLETKFMIPAFWVLTGLSALVLGPRELLRRPMLWLGAALAVACTVPTLVWQATHGWPYLQMGQVVASESTGKPAFVIASVAGAGILAGVVGLCYGYWRLLRAPELRSYRFLAVALLATFVAFLLTDGRFYYTMGLYALPFGAAAAELSRRRMAKPWRLMVWPVFALSAVLTVVQLPIYPVSQVRGMPESWHGIPLGSTFASGELPQRDVGIRAGQAYAALPEDVRERTAVFAEIYPFAAATDYYGRGYGIDQVYSGHRGYWYFGMPAETEDKVLVVNPSRAEGKRDQLAPYFRTSHEVVGGLVTLYEGRERPWHEIWPQLRNN